MKMFLSTFAALALMIGPSVAFAHPINGSGAHMRPKLFHDRSPKLHDHGSVAHH